VSDKNHRQPLQQGLEGSRSGHPHPNHSPPLKIRDLSAVAAAHPHRYLDVILAIMEFLMQMLLGILEILLKVAGWIIFGHAILSWLISFNVINTHNDFVRSVWTALEKITAPVYRPIRKILPDFGALDLSPMVALIIVWILQGPVLQQLKDMAY
jgi:YggT family protein